MVNCTCTTYMRTVAIDDPYKLDAAHTYQPESSLVADIIFSLFSLTKTRLAGNELISLDHVTLGVG